MTDRGTSDTCDDALLEAHFAALKARPEVPTGALMASLVADARAMADRPSPGAFSVLGGWLGMGGLAAAAVAGLLVGLADPSAVDALLPGEGATGLSFDAYYGLTDPMELAGG